MATGEEDRTGPLGAKVAFLTVAGLVVLVALAWAGVALGSGGRAPRDARVEGVSVAGLTSAQAQQRLRDRLAHRATEPIEVSYGDGRALQVDPRKAGLRIDYAASARAAGAGRGWGPSRIWQIATGGGDHRAVLDVDETRMQQTVDSLAEGIGHGPTDGTVAFRAGRAVAVTGHSGIAISRSRTEALLETRFLRGGSTKLPTETAAPSVAPVEVRRALSAVGRPAMSAPVTATLAGQPVRISPRVLGSVLTMRVEGSRLVPVVDGDALLDALAGTVGREPRDAQVVLRGGRPVVVPGRVGVTVDPDVLAARVQVAMLRHGSARRAVVPGTATRPSVTTARVQALGVRQRVGSTSTSFPYSADRNAELTQAAQRVDGTLLRPGQTFSLNAALGSSARGQLTELSATLFGAAFRAGLADVEHASPRVYSAALPAGLDATLVWPSVDLKFRDDTPHGVLVAAEVRRATAGHPGRVSVTLWSTPRWRVSVRSGRRTSVVAPRVRWDTSRSCHPVAGSPGFGIDVVRTLRSLRTGGLVSTQKVHTDYSRGTTVRCRRPAKPHHH